MQYQYFIFYISFLVISRNLRNFCQYYEWFCIVLLFEVDPIWSQKKKKYLHFC